MDYNLIKEHDWVYKLTTEHGLLADAETLFLQADYRTWLTITT
jgi:hypothetical protein